MSHQVPLLRNNERGFSPVLAQFRVKNGRKATLDLYAGENPRSIYADGAVCALANLQLLKQRGTAGEYVAIGGIEIAGIPGIGHVAGAVGPVE